MKLLCLFLASAAAFSPSSLAPQSVVRARSAQLATPITMAGWQDSYAGDALKAGKKGKLAKGKKTDFDQMMEDQKAEQVKIWGGASIALTAAFFLFLGGQIAGL